MGLWQKYWEIVVSISCVAKIYCSVGPWPEQVQASLELHHDYNECDPSRIANGAFHCNQYQPTQFGTKICLLHRAFPNPHRWKGEKFSMFKEQIFFSDSNSVGALICDAKASQESLKCLVSLEKSIDSGFKILPLGIKPFSTLPLLH